jgi:hypothetical protein
MLGRALVGRGQDRLGAAHVEDHASRLDSRYGAGDDLRFALRVLTENLLALDLAQALTDKLRGHLGVDAAEGTCVEVADPYQIADLGVGLVLLGVVYRELGGFVLDVIDDDHGSVGVEATAVLVYVDVDILISGARAPVGGLNCVGESGDELLAGDVLLGIQLEERANEIAVQVRPPFAVLSVPR